MKKEWISILIVGLTLGTAWAIRGQFGHEEGAAWAGAIGAFGLVLVSGRRDWYSKVLLIAMSSAVGWGAGGMISYGKVVGYGRSIGYLNASYGLLMLFVIGGLFGLLGGGFVGLTLGSSNEKKVNWSSLVAEMAAGGLITYSLLIKQLEILMTPPRSEAWAVCLGAGMAMLWYMARNKFIAPLRVAFFSALGAGFGFAFGNFLQISGDILAIDFNMWNVMEYSIGFFGGISMAYGVFTSKWPEESLKPEPWENISSFFVIFIIIPLFVFTNSKLYDVLKGAGADARDLTDVPLIAGISGLIIVIAIAVNGFLRMIKQGSSFTRKDALILFLTFFAAYIFLSYSVTGAFNGVFHLNHHLYILNFAVIIILAGRKFPAFFQENGQDTGGSKWILWLAAALMIIMLLSFLLINMHGELNGACSRFPNL